MQNSTAPDKIVLPFSESGGRRDIPVASQILVTPGAASYTDGFPPLTRTPIEEGGVPPFGVDMNGILFAISSISRWASAGGGFPYDSAFASEVSGYPAGARVMHSNGDGYWLNTVDNNEVNPESTTTGEAATAGWRPEFCGISEVAIPDATVTLTPVQYGQNVIVLSGALSASRSVYFPDIDGQWVIVNKCTGNFAAILRTQSGSEYILSMPGQMVRMAVENGEVNEGVEGLRADGLALKSISGNINYSDLRGTVVATCLADITLTLPNVNGIGFGTRVDFLNPTDYKVTINAYAAQSILNPAGNSVSSIVLYPGDTLTLECPQAASWQVIGGTAASKTALPIISGSRFIIPLGGSVMIQGGTETIAGQSTVVVSLPTPAVNGTLFCTASKGWAISLTGEYCVGAQSDGLTDIKITNSAPTTADQTINWIALTY